MVWFIFFVLNMLVLLQVPLFRLMGVLVHLVVYKYGFRKDMAVVW